MRVKLTILLLSLWASGSSQVKGFASMRFDPKMMLSGPGYSYTDIQSAFNYEIQAGIRGYLQEDRGIRFAMALEVFHEIGYKKWAFIQVDYFREDILIDGLGLYVGGEIGVIYREIPESYIQVEESYSPGVNAGAYYRIWPWLAVTAGVNAFAAEAALRRDDKYLRWDVMGGLEIEF